MVRIVASPRMASLTSLHLGGRALALATFESAADLETLPEALQQAAARRLEYPDLSLAALCGCFDPPMSKSGLSHRMKKLEALADALRQRLEEHTETEEAGA